MEDRTPVLERKLIKEIVLQVLMVLPDNVIPDGGQQFMLLSGAP